MSAQTGYRYSHTVGFHAETGQGFNDPVDMAIRRDGVIFVVNRGGVDVDFQQGIRRVTMCTVDEQYLGQFGTGGLGDGELMWPVSIAIDSDDNVYVADESLNRISIFNRQGQFVGKWGVKGQGDGEFDRPAGIAFDKENNLLVADGLNNRIQRYTKEGRYLGAWGRAGSGDGEFNMPWLITIDKTGDVYVADWRNDRIQKFDADGKHLANFGRPGRGDGELHRPSGATVDQDGNLIVADWGNERVQVLAPDGSFLAKFRGESGLSTWGQNYYVSNQDELEARMSSNLEPELDLYPDNYLRDQSAAIEKLFWSPTSVRVDTEGRFYVVESSRQRIQIYHK